MKCSGCQQEITTTPTIRWVWLRNNSQAHEEPICSDACRAKVVEHYAPRHGPYTGYIWSMFETVAATGEYTSWYWPSDDYYKAGDVVEIETDEGAASTRTRGVVLSVDVVRDRYVVAVPRLYDDEEPEQIEVAQGEVLGLA